MFTRTVSLENRNQSNFRHLHCCHGPRQQFIPIQLLAHSPCSGMGKRRRGVKVRKFIGWDKVRSIGKGKVVCSSNENPVIYSQLPTGWQVFSLSRKAGLHHTQWVLEKTNAIISNSFAFSFPELYLSMAPHCMEYQFGHLGLAALTVFLLSLFCIPSLLSGWVGHEEEHPLSLGKNCSAITKTFLCYQQVFTGKPK